MRFKIMAILLLCDFVQSWSDECHFSISTEGDIEEIKSILKGHNIHYLFQVIFADNTHYFKAPMSRQHFMGILQQNKTLIDKISPLIHYHSYWKLQKKLNKHMHNRPQTHVKRKPDAVYEKQVKHKANRLRKKLNFNDPYATGAWQFLNDGTSVISRMPGLDLNVYPVYEAGYTGSGVKVIIVDDALDTTHEDLAANIDKNLTFDLVNQDRHDARGTDFRMPNSDRHGTQCASLVGAIANNSKCAFGVAYNATIGGIRLLNGKTTDPLVVKAMMMFAKEAQIYTSSWGPDDDGNYMRAIDKLVYKAFNHTFTEGNHGRGTVLLFPAGNGGNNNDNCGADSFVNNHAVVAVTSIGEQGGPPDYTEQCAAISISVPTAGSPPRRIDRDHTQKHAVPTAAINNACSDKFFGTSAANPLAAGCIALAFEANPNLTSRDVHSLLAVSGRVPAASSGPWYLNGAGYLVSPRYGAGLLNAVRLVNLALKWNSVGPVCISSAERGILSSYKKLRKKNMSQLSNESGPKMISEIYRGQKTRFIFEINEHGKIRGEVSKNSPNACELDRVEVVLVRMQWVHERRGNVQVTLKSPSDLKATLLYPRKNDDKDTFSEITWKSLMHVGENVHGSWIIEVQDVGRKRRATSDRSGFISFISLQFRGTKLKESAFELNRAAIESHWNAMNKQARKLGKTRKLNAFQVGEMYDTQKWEALLEQVAPKNLA